MLMQPTYFFTDDLDRDAVDAFEKYDLISAPVLNLQRQVVGRITVDAVIDEIKEPAQRQHIRHVGQKEDDEALLAPAGSSTLTRCPWPAHNLLTPIIAPPVPPPP